jgi:hypothetical protein
MTEPYDSLDGGVGILLVGLLFALGMFALIALTVLLASGWRP